MSPVDYHGWTHVPKERGGTDPIPGLFGNEIDWAIASGISTVSAANTIPTNINWVNWAKAPGSAAFATPVADDRPIKIILDGWYQFWLQIEWTAAGFTDVRQYLLYGLGAGFWDYTSFSGFEPRISESDPYRSGGMMSVGPMHVIANSGFNIGVAVTQSSGGSRDFDTGALAAVYLGPGLGLDPGQTTITDLLVAF